MVIYGIPGDVKGFAEGELSKESEKFVGGKSTMEKNTYWGPGTPPNTDWHRQLVTSGQLNLGDRQLIEIYCQHTLQISAQISNFWVLEALCSAAVT
jgi:phosphatidylethanolamine-binding protein (PEBP) family uncharacterized protein